MVKIFLAEIKIYNKESNLIFDHKSNMILDKISGAEIITGLPDIIPHIVRLQAKFDRYATDYSYNAITNNIRNTFCYKVYKIFIHINPVMMFDNNVTVRKYLPYVREWIFFILSNKIGKNNRININNISPKKILGIDKINIYPIYIVETGKNIWFNILNNSFTKNPVPIMRLVNTYVVDTTNAAPLVKILNNIMITDKHNDRTLIIIPENIKNIWLDYNIDYTIIVHESNKLYSLKNEFSIDKEKYDILIIHNFIIGYYPLIKKFKSVKKIIIINTFCTISYINKCAKSKKIDNDKFMALYFGLVSNCDICKEENIDLAIRNYISNNLHNIYNTFDPLENINMNRIFLKPNKIEKMIIDTFIKIIDLLVESKRIIKREYYFRVVSKLYTSIIVIILSTVNDLNIENYTKFLLSDLITKNNILWDDISKHLNAIIITRKEYNFNNVDYNSMIKEHENMKKNVSDNINKYKKYLDNILKKYNTECSICLCEFNIKTRAICGHCFCLECIIRSISGAGNKCPLCKEFLSLRLINIIDNCDASGIIEYFRKLGPESLVITNDEINRSIKLSVPKYNFRSESYNSDSIYGFAEQSIDNILFVISPMKSLDKKDKRKINKIICHYHMMKKNVNITSIELDFKSDLFDT